jgi:hypothetical protein
MSRMLRDFSVYFQWVSVALGSSTRHTRDMNGLVDRILEQLKRNAPLNDPRALAGRVVPLADHVLVEVQRIINTLPLGLAPTLTASAARQRAELHLRRGERLQATMFAHHAQRGVPDGGDKLKIRCAEEAYSLMEWFSPDPAPTGTAGGPYLMITALLHEAATGTLADDPGTDMKRACTRWLKYKRKWPSNTPAFKLPPLKRA